MTTVTGQQVQTGFALESTQNTAVAATNFVPILSETMTAHTVPMFDQGLGGGDYYEAASVVGEKVVGGNVTTNLTTAQLKDQLSLIFGGTPSETDADPVFTNEWSSGALPTATWEILRGTQMFDYVGCMVESATLSQAASAFGTLSCNYFAYDEVTGGSTATYAPPSSPGLATFRNLTSTTPDGAVCFDAVDVTVATGIERSFQSCAADAGRAKIREAGRRMITGSLVGDYADDLTAHNRQIAGTAGALEIEWSLSASLSLTLALNVVYMPTVAINVAGPGTIKSTIPFKVVGSDPVTVTLVNGES